MKKLFTLVFVVITVCASAQSKTVIHYWNFGSFTGTTGAAAVDVVANPQTPYQADYSIFATAPTVIYQALPGTASPYLTYWDNAGVGSSINYQSVMINNSLPDSVHSLRTRNPSDKMELLFSIPSTGYKDLTFAFATEPSSATAPAVQYYDYSTDGGKTYINTGLSMDSLTLNTGSKMFVSSIIAINNTAAENNPNLIFRIRTGTPNSGASGNDRYTNVSLTGVFTLPLTLQSFDGAISNSTTNLWWASNNEVNVKEFVIESSSDNKEYALIGTVTAKDAKGINEYSFETTALPTTTYYRLKMIDNDGAFTYSPIVVLKGSANSGLSVFPNPVVNSITLSHNKTLNNAFIEIIAIDGKKVIRTNVQEGATQTKINVSNLLKGTYIVSYFNNGNKINTKFVK